MTARHRIITRDMLDGEAGDNINGPACIAVPPWCEAPLGSYYLYFAHHRGNHIRLAFADSPQGPWEIHRAGVLDLATLPQCRDHVASPEVIVVPERQEIRLYFHALDPHSGTQLTFVAHSADGLRFTAAPRPIAPFYLRLVRWRQLWIGMSKGGAISISQDGGNNFKTLHAPAFPASDAMANGQGDIRHVALVLESDRLWVLFSRIGDAPEHIRLGYIDLLRPIVAWKVEESVPLLLPEQGWEGADLPVSPSRSGAAIAPEHALRDPAVLLTSEGNWLFYSYAGERGIAITSLPDLAACFLSRHRLAHVAPSVPPAAAPQPEIEAAMRHLAQPGMLARRLEELDLISARQRLFLMGCGRSGTWLLTSLMSCFNETTVVAKELPVEAFALLKTDQPSIVLKRAWDSYRHAVAIPHAIGIICIVRHPYDVLTSHNPETARKYHIAPERWVGELQALRQMLEGGRSQLLVLRYEDLVDDPQAVLTGIAGRFGLVQGRDPADSQRTAVLPPEAVRAMHGTRPIDRSSVGRYRHDPEAIAHLRAIMPQLGETLTWMAQRFAYDLHLPPVIQTADTNDF